MNFVKQIGIFLSQSWRRITDFLRSIIQSIKLHRTNALTSLVILFAVVIAACLYATQATTDLIVRYTLLALSTGMVIYIVMKYEYWSKKDPDRLHSEDHIEVMKQWDVIARQGHATTLPENSIIVPQPPLLKGESET